jgi:hypothetical protein
MTIFLETAPEVRFPANGSLPAKHDTVIIDKVVYYVHDVIYNFDEETITVVLHS